MGPRTDFPVSALNQDPHLNKAPGYLAVAEVHDTHRVCRSPLVRHCVFRDPKIPVSENPTDLEAGRLAGMMTPQGLQIVSPEDSLA